MIIYINFSDYQSSRDLQLLKMFQFEKGNSFHPKTVVSHLKTAKPMYKADRIMVAQCIHRNKSFNDQFTEGRVTYTDWFAFQQLLFNRRSEILEKPESLLFSGDAKIDVNTSPSHYVISKPIKLTASWLKFAALLRKRRKRPYHLEIFTCIFVLMTLPVFGSTWPVATRVLS